MNMQHLCHRSNRNGPSGFWGKPDLNEQWYAKLVFLFFFFVLFWKHHHSGTGSNIRPQNWIKIYFENPRSASHRLIFQVFAPSAIWAILKEKQTISLTGAHSSQSVSSPASCPLKRWPWRCSSASSSRPSSSSGRRPARSPRSPAARPTLPARLTTPCTRSERASPVSRGRRPRSKPIRGGAFAGGPTRRTCSSWPPVLTVRRFRRHERLHYPSHPQAALLLLRPDSPPLPLQLPVPGLPTPLPLWSPVLYAALWLRSARRRTSSSRLEEGNVSWRLLWTHLVTLLNEGVLICPVHPLRYWCLHECDHYYYHYCD